MVSIKLFLLFSIGCNFVTEFIIDMVLLIYIGFIMDLSIEARFNNLEKMLISNKAVLSFDEFCQYCGFSKSFGYKLTSTGRVPHFKPTGKMIYFSKAEIDTWLMQNPIKTAAQIETESANYLLKRGAL
jgi:excisionase family DNA binding protein